MIDGNTFDVTTLEATLDYTPRVYQHYAGICIYYCNFDYLLFRKTWCEDYQGASLDLLRVTNGERIENPGSRVEIGDSKVRLRLTVDGRSLSFAYQVGDAAFQTIGPAYDMSEFSDEFCTGGEFTGTSVGLFCVDALFHSQEALFSDVVLRQEV